MREARILKSDFKATILESISIVADCDSILISENHQRKIFSADGFSLLPLIGRQTADLQITSLNSSDTP